MARGANLLAARTRVYEQAKAAHPDRWRTRPVRNWTPIGAVWLNPENQLAQRPPETLPLAA